MKNKITIILSALILLVAVPAFSQTWEDAPGTPPSCVKSDGTISQGCYPPIDSSSVGQIKGGSLYINGLLWARNKILVNINPLSTGASNLPNGAIGANKYCDENGQNCSTTTPNNWGGSPTNIFPTSCGQNEIVKWISGSWQCSTDVATASNTGGTVTSVTAGQGLAVGGQASGGVITGAGTLNLRACQTGEILKSTGWGTWDCKTDAGGTGGGDNLGNHTLGQPLNLNGHRISGDGSVGTGLFINSGGGASFTNDLLVGGDLTVGNAGPTPNGDLTVRGDFYYKTGGPAQGMVLTALDTNGGASWKYPTKPTLRSYTATIGGSNPTDDLTLGSHDVCYLTGNWGSAVTYCEATFSGTLNSATSKPSWTLNIAGGPGWCKAICMD